MYTFRWCRDCKTSDAAKANMELTFREHKGHKIPIIHNHVIVEQHQKLLIWQKPKAEAKSALASSSQELCVDGCDC